MGRVDSFAMREPRLTEPEPRDDEAEALLADRVQERNEDMRREEGL